MKTIPFQNLIVIAIVLLLSTSKGYASYEPYRDTIAGSSIAINGGLVITDSRLGDPTWSQIEEHTDEVQFLPR